MPDNEPDALLTVGEAAALLKTTRQAVYQWRRRRQGPPGAIIGARLLFRREDVTRWVGEQIDLDERARRPSRTPQTSSRRRRLIVKQGAPEALPAPRAQEAGDASAVPGSA